MSLEAKLVLVVCALAITVPLMVLVVRRIIRGEPFGKPGMGDMPLPPPGGPSGDGGGG